MARNIKKVGLGLLAFGAIASVATAVSATIYPDGTIVIVRDANGNSTT